MTLGQRIQEHRLRLELSQEALGERLGVSRQAVSKWEADAAVPDTDKLIALSKLFGLTLNELLQVEGPEAGQAAENAEETPRSELREEEKLGKKKMHAASWLLPGLAVLALVLGLTAMTVSFGRMAVSWAAVYLGNFLGSALMAFLVCESGQMSGFSGAVAGNAIRAAVTKTSLDPGKAVLLGILCNFLVCAAVFISMMGTTVADKLLGLYFPIMLFVLGGFEHSVANMYYIPAGLFAAAKPEYAALAAAQGISLDGLTWQSFFLGNLLPVTVGNVLGGAALGVLLWGAYLWKGKRA